MCWIVVSVVLSCQTVGYHGLNPCWVVAAYSVEQTTSKRLQLFIIYFSQCVLSHGTSADYCTLKNGLNHQFGNSAVPNQPWHWWYDVAANLANQMKSKWLQFLTMSINHIILANGSLMSSFGMQKPSPYAPKLMYYCCCPSGSIEPRWAANSLSQRPKGPLLQCALVCSCSRSGGLGAAKELGY